MTSAKSNKWRWRLSTGVMSVSAAILAVFFMGCTGQGMPSDSGKARGAKVDQDQTKKNDKNLKKVSSTPKIEEAKTHVPAGVRRFAVLVGLDGYAPNFLDLRFAEKDVEDLAKLLIEGGYHKNDVVVLTGVRGKADPKLTPTVEHIRASLKATTEKMTDRDLLVVALAGHGVEPNRGEQSYCAHQAKKVGEGKYINLLRIQEVYEQLGKAPGSLKLLLVDACRNDPSARMADSDDGFKSVTAPPTARNTVAFYSCSPGERSWEPDKLEHGLFMYHVIEGLREKANYFQDGRMVWQNLVSYTDREVRSYSRNVLGKGRVQQPHFKGEARGEVPPLLVWEGLAPPPPDESKRALAHLLINEDFLKVKAPSKPRGWEGPEMRVAQDKQQRQCLEPIGTEGIREVTLPKVAISGDFFIEIEYVLDGTYANTGDFGTHQLIVTLEGREGADRIRADVDYAGRAVVGNTDRRLAPNYQPCKLTRFRLEREGKEYRILLNDEFAAGGEQTVSADFDTIRLGLTAGIPPTWHTLKERARIYSVKVGGMKGRKSEAPPKALPYQEDFRTVSLAGVPSGWSAPDFYVGTDKAKSRCLEARGEKDVKFLTLPRFSLKGDFFIEIQYILDGTYAQSGKAGTHQLFVILQSEGFRIPVMVDYAGRTTIGGSEPRVPARYKPHQLSRLRLEREGRVFRVSLNDAPAVGLRVDYTGDFHAIRLGLTAGIPPTWHTLKERARIYSVKVVSLKPPEPVKHSPRPEGGVREDFRSYKVGELPNDWEASKLANLAIQPGAVKQGLELIGRDTLADSVKFPLDLPGKFIASFEVEVNDKDSIANLAFTGEKVVVRGRRQVDGQFQVGVRGDKKLVLLGVQLLDIAKFWKDNQPQFVQVERTATQYRFKVNDQEAGSIPIPPVARGAFTNGLIGMGVKEKKSATPRITLVRIAPLK